MSTILKQRRFSKKRWNYLYSQCEPEDLSETLAYPFESEDAESVEVWFSH